MSHWNNRLDIGLAFQSGDLDKVDYNFNFRTELRESERPASYLYTFRRDYGWQRNQAGQSTVIRDRINSTFRFRYTTAERFFFQTFTQYDRRVVQGIRHDLEQSAGLGYRYLRSPVGPAPLPLLSVCAIANSMPARTTATYPLVCCKT
ncbi:MAG: DUF481 domain-containing protein [Verrucomicrobia bacterium]|nr:DUF481 domain-containing protein [Verrucomicrobiota bacterium]